MGNREIRTFVSMSAPDEPKKPDLKSFGGYTIFTSAETQKDGIYGIAYCPICGRKEESHDHGHGEQHAINISVGKVRTHMKLVHKKT